MATVAQRRALVPPRAHPYRRPRLLRLPRALRSSTAMPTRSRWRTPTAPSHIPSATISTLLLGPGYPHHPPGDEPAGRKRRRGGLGRRTGRPLLRGRAVAEPLVGPPRSPSHPVGQSPEPGGRGPCHVPHQIPRRGSVQSDPSSTPRPGGHVASRSAIGARRPEQGCPGTGGITYQATSTQATRPIKRSPQPPNVCTASPKRRWQRSAVLPGSASSTPGTSCLSFSTSPTSTRLKSRYPWPLTQRHTGTRGRRFAYASGGPRRDQ